MLREYDDIISRLGEPRWYDGNGAPRYYKFSPEQCGVYIKAVALLRIACQDCGKEFIVASEYEDDILHRIVFPEHKMMRPNPKDGSIGSFHYGDPPSYGHCAAGPTMNCEDSEVLEYWERVNFEWVRLSECEGILSFEDRCPYCGGSKGEELCIGNDECTCGDDGGPAHVCDGWGDHCCKCGRSFALGQI